MDITKIKAMKPNKRAKFLKGLSDHEIESITVPCYGEAHSNPYIDHCMVCLNVRWGRILKEE